MSSARRLRVLAVTSLFPNSVLPHSSSFNRQQLSALAERCELELWAPIPWFPLADRIAPSSSAGRAAGVPPRDVVAGLEVHHPRTMQLPIVGRPIAGPLYAGSLAARLYARRSDFDVVLATWAYPDGFALVALGSAMGIPTVVKVHGSDINVVARKWAQRAQMRAVFPRAAGFIAVSRPLADGLCELGVEADKVHFIPNGVDRSRFSPSEPGAARAALEIPDDAAVVVYVGNLKREKGVLDLIESWPTVRAERPDARLYVVGGGPDEAEVARAAASDDSIVRVGPVAHDQVPVWLAASDVLCLPSWNEGTPNVVLEAHASGRPVVASSVGGCPDLITEPALGRLVPPRDPSALATALISVLQQPSEPSAVTLAAETISWPQSADRVLAVLEEAAR